MSVVNLLSRYLAGDHRQVWDELLSHGPVVRMPPFVDQANDVVRETMNRVRENIESLVRGLEKHRFVFGQYPDGEEVPGYEAPLVPPPDDVDERIVEIERLAGGPIPLSLAGFWRHVGSVNLVGSHADWPENTDPLWVDTPELTIDEFPNWLDRRTSDPDEPSFAAQIAPDVLHKDNVSGGLPYEIALPDAAIDGRLLNGASDLYFVDYLRQALQWGGFPGFASDPEAMPRWLDRLRKEIRGF
jgi:hypothetical protein